MSVPDNPQYVDRIAKMEKWAALGVDPFGQRTDGLVSTAAARKLHQGVTVTPHDGGAIAKVAGRIILLRSFGKLILLTIQDWTGRIQIGLAKQAMEEAFPQAKLLELGDIAWFEGKVGHTKTEEVTIWASGFGILSKALLPPPDKFHGLSDTELRYRQRYVDLFANPESMEVFLFRSRMIDSIRDFLKGREYVEVETPLMQAVAGGAAARPFVTHHNALDLDLYLRISPELYLKRLMVGGMERVFDINRNFRNEGIDTTHNPEFTMLECYQAYSDLAGMMELTESLVLRLVTERLEALHAMKAETRNVVEGENRKPKTENRNEGVPSGGETLGGGLRLPFGDRFFDYTPPFARASYAEMFQQHVGVEMSDVEGVRRIAAERGVQLGEKEHDVIVGELFEQLAEPRLGEMDRPVFLYDYPAALCPLTKRKRSNPNLAERFELYIAGMEIANAYTELNDPLVQESTFSKQLAGLKEEDSMAKMDDDFINALRYGMPPAGGLGLGIDRLTMLLTNRQSIRDVVLFPLLKPHSGDGGSGGNPARLKPEGGPGVLQDVDEAQMERDVEKLESDLAKVKATTAIRPIMFVLDKDGSLRVFDV